MKKHEEKFIHLENTPEWWPFQEVLLPGEKQLHQQYHMKVHDSVSSIRSKRKLINYLH
jgi:hypothetical protein